jgi:uncharacterized oligopeptide transporter (OPT) family protein
VVQALLDLLSHLSIVPEPGLPIAYNAIDMPCLLLLLFLLFPRLAIVLLYFLSNYLDRAYHSVLMILLGFIFLPLTTLVYAWEVNSGLPLAGINIVWLILAVLVDIGAIGGGGYHRRRRT